MNKHKTNKAFIYQISVFTYAFKKKFKIYKLILYYEQIWVNND